MKIFFITVSIFFLSSCTPGQKEKKQTQNQEKEESTQVVSKKACFDSCESYQNACKSLNDTNEMCAKDLVSKDSKNCRAVIENLAEFERIAYDSHSCDNSCLNVSNENQMLVCESNDKYKNLTKKVLSSILKSKDKFVKKFQLSEKLFKFDDKDFVQNYSSLKNNFKITPQLSKIKATQEVSDNSFFEIWIRKNEIDCLPKNVKKYIKKGEENKGSELDITRFKDSILASCGISELKFLRGEAINRYKSKLQSITYSYEGALSGDCNYPIPRISLTYKQSSKAQVLISDKYKLLEAKKDKELIGLLNKYNRFFETGYGSDIIAMFEYERKTYVIASVISMAASYEVYELNEFGMIQTNAGDYEEPCGS